MDEKKKKLEIPRPVLSGATSHAPLHMVPELQQTLTDRVAAALTSLDFKHATLFGKGFHFPLDNSPALNLPTLAHFTQRQSNHI